MGRVGLFLETRGRFDDSFDEDEVSTSSLTEEPPSTTASSTAASSTVASSTAASSTVASSAAPTTNLPARLPTTQMTTQAASTPMTILSHYFSSLPSSTSSSSSPSPSYSPLLLAHKYITGLTVPQSCQTALALYEISSNLSIDSLELTTHSGKFSHPSAHNRLLSSYASRSTHHNDAHDERKETLEYWRFRAGEGDKNAAYNLGNHYARGARGVEQDLDKAVEYLTIGAENGSRGAAGMLGMIYLLAPSESASLESSSTIKYDPVLAAKYFRQGAPEGISCRKENQCDANSLNGQALLLLWGINLKDGKENQYLMYETDLAAKQRKLEQVKKLLRMAGDGGSPDGYYHLGLFYSGWMQDAHLQNLEGADLTDSATLASLARKNLLPTHKDYEVAFSFLSKAAQQGHVPAMHRVGLMYKKGIGVKSNCEAAVTAFKYVAERGLTPSSLTKQAYSLFKEGDYLASLNKYIRAAELGIDSAMANAAFLLERGHCGNRDPVECAKLALRYFKGAARQGNADACIKVGDFMYYRVIESAGRDAGYADDASDAEIQGSYEMAAEYYKKAVDLNMPRAMYNLGYLYQWGLGVKRDFPLAKRYYDMAREHSPDASVPITFALIGLKLHENVLKLLDYFAGDGPLIDQAGEKASIKKEIKESLRAEREREKATKEENLRAKREKIKKEKKKAREREREAKNKAKLKKQNKKNNKHKNKRGVTVALIAPIVVRHILDTDTLMICILLGCMYLVMKYRKVRERIKRVQDERERLEREEQLEEEKREGVQEELQGQ